MRVQVRHCYISPGHNFFGHHGRPPGGYPMLELPALNCLAHRGIEGDRFCDYEENYRGQITFFDGETFDMLCHQFGIFDKPPSVLRRNVITWGADLPALIGVEFEIQGIRFLGTEECRPCYWMNLAFHPGAEDAMKGRGGLRARILGDGILRSGVD